MPAIPPPIELLESGLVYRSVYSPTVNTTAQALKVICAWPVSGQYGPGTRVLYGLESSHSTRLDNQLTSRHRYYVLMAACVFARKAEWILNAGLAAVLLFPAVAALHAIVLAALHRSGKFVDCYKWS